ncbi:MAG: hypothetical protein H6578_05585 [Chitinophagales bacterium]|nr:hypothetical protein [Chitinophagales bacterium]
MKQTIFYLFLLLVILNSCEKSPNGGVPSYVQIDSVILNTNAAQGSNQNGINTLWIESEGEEIGTFEFPTIVPALVQGNREIIINAGVYVNGDYFNREIYPAYKPYTANVNFKLKDTLKITPQFEYYEDVGFIINENFESGNIFSTSDRTATGDTNNIDGRCLHIHLDNTNSSVSLLSSSSYQLPPSGRTYIELQTKYTNDFAIGVKAVNNGVVSPETYIQIFTNTSDWTYLYQDITTLLVNLNADAYVFFIQSSKYTDVSSSDVYIDNFKVLTF